jgi:hypothetical protein
MNTAFWAATRLARAPAQPRAERDLRHGPRRRPQSLEVARLIEREYFAFTPPPGYD